MTRRALFFAHHSSRLRSVGLSIAAGVIAAMSFSLAGCTPEAGESTGPSGTSGGDTTPNRPTIALVMKDLGNEFFQTMADGATAHQAENADRYDLIVDGIQNEQDLNRQVAIMSQLVARGVDAIVIAPADSRGLVPAVKKAIDAGIPVVNIDNQLDTEKLAAEGLEVPFVGPDNRAGAREVGAYLAGRLGPNAKVAILEGIPTAFNAVERRAGFEEAMEEAGIAVVDVQTAEWDTNKAGQIATAMLNAHDDLDAILASNDSMAIGALSAVRSKGRDAGDDRVLVVGFDNIAAAAKAVDEGRLLATADQHAGELAVFGIEAALDRLDGKEVADRQTPVDLIVKSGAADVEASAAADGADGADGVE